MGSGQIIRCGIEHDITSQVFASRQNCAPFDIPTVNPNAPMETTELLFAKTQGCACLHTPIQNSNQIYLSMRTLTKNTTSTMQSHVLVFEVDILFCILLSIASIWYPHMLITGVGAIFWAILIPACETGATHPRNMWEPLRHDLCLCFRHKQIIWMYLLLLKKK